MQGFAIRVGVDGDAGLARIAASANDPHRDLTAVGDQYLAHFPGTSRSRV
jgi:hypothetical protein